jgi:hypothetical protein
MTLNLQAMTRDEILRQLKESRTAKAQAAAAPALNAKFKKVPASDKTGKKKFVETVNGRRREVLLLTGKDGNAKRKTRWIDPEPLAGDSMQTAPLGMEVPAEMLAKQKALAEQEAADEDNDDIFQGVGAVYDPLKDIDSSSDADDADTEPAVNGQTQTAKPRNYFGDPVTEDGDKAKPVASNPTILAALKRAAAIRQSEEKEKGAAEETESDRQKQLLAKLKQRDRDDAADLDLGFGESRFGDDEEEEGAVWDDEEERGGSKRKRGPKKRKGDKDNVADVMSIIDGRKKA